MIRLKNIVVMLSVLCVVACTENNIAYDEVVNVPEEYTSLGALLNSLYPLKRVG